MLCTGTLAIRYIFLSPPLGTFPQPPVLCVAYALVLRVKNSKPQIKLAIV